MKPYQKAIIELLSVATFILAVFGGYTMVHNLIPGLVVFVVMIVSIPLRWKLKERWERGFWCPTCPTCKRHYHADDTFQFEKDTEWMRRPDGNTDIKRELVYLISNLAMLIQQSYTRDSKSKKQLVYDLDRFLKSYNDHYHLEIDRYTDKPDDIKHQIRLKEHKIEKLKRDLDYQKNWHEDRKPTGRTKETQIKIIPFFSFKP